MSTYGMIFAIALLPVRGFSQNGSHQTSAPKHSILSPTKTQWDEFDLLYQDRYFYIDNRGLTRVVVQLNGFQFKLAVDPNEVAKGANSYLIPLNGIVNIDIFSLLNPEHNRMRIEGTGPQGADAIIIIADHLIGQQIDYVLHLVPLPEAIQLLQNFPNPFNPSTTIMYEVPRKFSDGVNVKLEIYNTLGEKVKTLVNEVNFSGVFRVQWDGRDDHGLTSSAGMYLYRLVVGDLRQTKRLVLLK